MHSKTNHQQYKLTAYIDTYVYVVKYLDEEMSNYLTESEEAINFYYRVEDKRTGIRISFILIYLVVVSLLLFYQFQLQLNFLLDFRINFQQFLHLIKLDKEILKPKFQKLKLTKS